MDEYEKVYNFQNLYKAHKAARHGKRNTKEVVDFELELSSNLVKISDDLKNKTYKLAGYYSFYVHDSKERKIHALHYIDRVVQHCICDEILAPKLEKRLVYDNAACRKHKGTHFTLKRVNGYLQSYYQKYGADGYFLKCDIRKFFDNIDHDILKQKLAKLFSDEDILWLLYLVIDSYETLPGKGLPMGNQTSQWFAIYYLDGFDRLIKEKFQIKFYSRYMDDCVLIHNNKKFLQDCLAYMTNYIKNDLKLEFNNKTQIFPIRNGVDYLGWNIYLTDTGKIVRKVRKQTKYKYKRKIKYFNYMYSIDGVELEEISQVLKSYHAHLSYEHTYKLEDKLLKKLVLVKNRSRT